VNPERNAGPRSPPSLEPKSTATARNSHMARMSVQNVTQARGAAVDPFGQRLGIEQPAASNALGATTARASVHSSAWTATALIP
jgi:hypothetical protein